MIRPQPASPASCQTRRVLTLMPAWASIAITRRLDGPQRADRLADEVGIAGRVDHVEPLAGVVEVHDARLDRVLVMLLFFVEVADAGAVVDAGLALHGAGVTSSWSTSVVLPADRARRRQCCECPRRCCAMMSSFVKSDES